MKLEMSFFFSVKEICLLTLIVLTGDFGSIFGKSGRIGSGRVGVGQLFKVWV